MIYAKVNANINLQDAINGELVRARINILGMMLSSDGAHKAR